MQKTHKEIVMSMRSLDKVTGGATSLGAIAQMAVLMGLISLNVLKI